MPGPGRLTGRSDLASVRPEMRGLGGEASMKARLTAGNSVGARRLIGIVAAVVVLAGVAVPIAGAAKDETVLVSRQSAGDGGVGGDGASTDPSISADGRYVAFHSAANNLSGADDDFVVNVFVRDTVANTTTLVSRQSAGDGGAGADGSSFFAAVSDDGRYVAFHSAATNLSTADTDLVNDVFVRDTVANTTTLVSRQSAGDGGLGGDAASSFAAISADGRFVAFQSAATNLSTSDDDLVTDVFVRDTATSTTTLASRQSTVDGGLGGDAASDSAAISADGRFVAFQSAATNLSGVDSGFIDVFVRDLVAGTTTLASRQSAGEGGAAANAGSLEPSISADGGQVAFHSGANNLSAVDNDLFLNVFVRDLGASTTTLASRQSAGGAGGDANSSFAAISADGRYVGFHSDADNLSAADNNAFTNVFVRDLATNVSTLVSRQSAADGGAGGDAASDSAAVSGDGRYVAFQSAATNLSGVDSAVIDVFVRDVLGDPTLPPSDTDPPGLDLSGKKKQKLGRAVTVKASCDEACTVVAEGTVKPKGKAKDKSKRAKKLELREDSAELDADATKKLKLKPSKRVKKKLKAARKGKATITVTATDAADNSTREKLKLKLG